MAQRTLAQDFVTVRRYVRATHPTDAFMHRIHAIIDNGATLTASQVRTAAKAAEERAHAEWLAEIDRRSAITQVSAAASAVAIVDSSIPKGTYTVVLDGGAHWVTFRVKPSKKPQYPSQLEVLTGPDNELSFTTIGELKHGGFAPWSSRHVPYWIDANAAQHVLARKDVQEAIQTLLGASAEERAQQGETYSDKTRVYEGDVLVSVRCYKCGRKLTVPNSIANGQGPDCLLKD